jgi:hypothetical protein
MKDKFSFFEVESKFKKDIVSGMKNINHNGRSLRIDLASEGTSMSGTGGDRPASFGGSQFGDKRGGGDRYSSGPRGGSRDGGSRFSGNRDNSYGEKGERKPREKGDNFKLDFKFDGGI